MFEGATILITGGTGSFGRTMVRRLMDSACAEIRVFSRDELKQDEMRRELVDERLRFYLGDVRDRLGVGQVLDGVDHIFHAAALKQVPSCEFFPMQAVATNVVGSSNVIEEAVRRGVRSIVCLSSDKAVYPINAMGMTKALMEKIVQSTGRSLRSGDSIVSCVRYGNVMFSRGSVIPLFVSQIKSRSPITVTDPEMTRFMLPLDSATELVEFAFANAGQGDIFVRRAPAATVGDLARVLMKLFEVELPLQPIGVRHGEKLFETLATREELSRAEKFADFFRIKVDDRNLNYEKYFSEGSELDPAADDYHSHNADRLSPEQLEELLLTLPEVRRELGLPHSVATA